MDDAKDLRNRLAGIEARLSLLETRPAAPDGTAGPDPEAEPDAAPAPKPRFWQLSSTADLVKAFFYLIGIPATAVLAWETFDTEIWSRGEIAAREQRAAAAEKLAELQSHNLDLATLEVGGDSHMAFVTMEMTRGRIERLTDEIHAIWTDHPDALYTAELYTLAEALQAGGRTGDAVEVVAGIDTAEMSTIERSDHALLQARLRYATGDGFDLEAARDHIREAGRIASSLPDPAEALTLSEKILAVRTINELWRDVGCEKVLPMAEGLRELTVAVPSDPATDPVRDHTLTVIDAVDRFCPQP